MATGYGENTIKNRLNQKWGKQGHCIRLQQHRGDPEALSDLIFAIGGGDTYSIEVKRITHKIASNHSKHRPRPLSFSHDFSVAMRSEEYPHQLARQTVYADRMGWTPLVLVLVVTPSVGTEEFLFDSRLLYNMMQEGAKSVKYQDFPRFHNQLLYDKLFKVSKGN